MKASSFVFTGVQKPLTLFGLPPKVMILVIAGMGCTFGLMVGVGFAPLAIPTSLAVVICLWTWLWRKNNQDCHFGNYLFSTPRFWASRGKTAFFLAGRATQLDRLP
ncbi:hypothetical protein [Ferrovibrio sp.]|uniref:hypothetical protein n=1 Tax=Ferrovibrio sp. TaxID=1917215 RepID=UPI000CC176FE|nr:hypothetical protein [Ferrovibrio sp.]MBS4047934.1 hypothetical protein [Alphaproteobacteria bacterium]PJI41881.1 MAG: hypothetical protein CTR53_05325 [Ferrovibrio sp.]